MGRRRSSSGGGGRSSGGRSRSRTPRKRGTSETAITTTRGRSRSRSKERQQSQQSQHHHQRLPPPPRRSPYPPMTQQYPPPPVVASGGMMRNVMSSALGTAAGIIAANTLLDAFRGYGNEQQLRQALIEDDQAFQEQYQPFEGEREEAEAIPPCSAQFQNLVQCLDTNPSHIESCQTPFEYYKACRNYMEFGAPMFWTNTSTSNSEFQQPDK